MKRTNTFALAPTEKQHWRLFEIANVCARLWNELNYRRRQSFFKGKLNWESRDLYDKYKSVVGSATAQQVQRKNNEAWRSFLLCLSSKRKANSRPHPKGQTAPLLERQGSGERKLLILMRCDCYWLEAVLEEWAGSTKGHAPKTQPVALSKAPVVHGVQGATARTADG